MKSLLTCALFCFASCLFAQIPKGKIISEVSLNFNYSQYMRGSIPNQNSSSYQEKSTTLSINNFHKYFYRKNVYLLTGIGFQHTENDRGNGNGYNISVGIGALRNLNKNLFIGLDFSLGTAKNFAYTYDNNISIDAGSSSQKYVNITPQLLYQVHPKILVFATFGNIGYIYSSSEYSKGFYFTNSINLNLNPRFWNYGFIYLWGKSKEKT